MKAFSRLAFFCLFFSFFAGCTNALTPVVINTPLVPSEIAKSRVIDENCVSTILYVFGRSGNATLKDVIDMHKPNKITLVDYEFRDSFFKQDYCLIVYGY